MNKNQELMNRIKEYRNICIFGHISPDGDCYGAQSAMKYFLKKIFADKNVYILGSGFSKAIPFFGEMDQVDDEIVSSSLGIVLDVSDMFRIEDPRIASVKEIVKIDHHMNSDQQDYPSVNISNTSACSACQMVGEFILENGYELDKEISERLFLGIVTDTGRFQYLSSSKGTFTLMEKIMETNIDFQKIYDFLYEGDEITTRAKGYISYNFKSCNGVAYIILNKEELKLLNIDYNYASTMVNCLSMMKEYPIWASFAESDDGLIRVEIRSKNYNVQQVATIFGGGGHLNASGCRLHNLEDCQKVIDELVKLIKE